jgi:DNA topoisomerase VI subunit B
MIPKLTRPEYSTTIPSNGKKIKYHPFTVKEEKILMLAAEGQDQDEITNAVTNCLNNCISSPSDLEVSSR